MSSLAASGRLYHAPRRLQQPTQDSAWMGSSGRAPGKTPGPVQRSQSKRAVEGEGDQAPMVNETMVLTIEPEGAAIDLPGCPKP